MLKEVQLVVASVQRSRPKSLWPGVLALIASFLYGVSPIDLIPDVIPLLGWSDDAAVFLTAAFFAWRCWRARKPAVR